MALYITLAAFIVAACAGTCWWWVTTHLSATERTAVYDIEEAADFVASQLPDEVNQRLDRDQVVWILGLHLAFLRRAGMATYGGVDEVAMQAAQGDATVIADEDESLDWVLARMHAAGDQTDPVDVTVVLDLSNSYLDRIGALGPSVQLGNT